MLQKTVAMAMAVAVLGMLPMGQVSAANANGAIAQGVDASKHNGAVNWGQVAASGMQFAFIKVGSTNSGVDPQFAANITGAQSAGLKTGIFCIPMQQHRNRHSRRPTWFYNGSKAIP